MFKKIGVLAYGAGADEEKITEAAIEAGADDIKSYDDGAVEVITSPEAFEAVKKAMEAAGLAPAEANVTMRADNDVAVDGETAQQVVKLLDKLEDLDDVQNVHHNADLPDSAYQ
jgi:transcriptional/translational regulatory protein YebC/TACO1